MAAAGRDRFRTGSSPHFDRRAIRGDAGVKCRHCNANLSDVFIDLGSAPASNAFLRAEDLARPELHFPLSVLTCNECLLVQIDEVQRHDALFSDDYVYFSSYSTSWLAHVRRYVEQVVTRLGLG